MIFGLLESSCSIFSNSAFGAVDTFQCKFGFNQQAMAVFQKVFSTRIEDRPSALEFKALVSQLL